VLAAGLAWLAPPAAAQNPRPITQAPLPPPGAPAPITPAPAAPAGAPLQIQPPTVSQDLRIVWEVKNRFRLFRREADFLRQVAAQSIKSVLAAEQIMAGETDGRGWGRALLWNQRPDPEGSGMMPFKRVGACVSLSLA